MTYEEFVLSKIPRAELAGFTPTSPPHPSLKGHQRDVAKWMCVGGRRACFMAFGLGKTRTHLQVALWCIEHEPSKKYLITCPLGVRHQFIHEDGPSMDIEMTFCQTDAEIDAATTPIVICNYEPVRDGKITLDTRFCGWGLDEASVLRSFGSKTYQNFLKLGQAIRYRFVFTATPSPNRHKELIHYGGFLGVMDTGQALTRFFQRDSQKAGNLTLFPHMEEQFWTWLASWSVFMQKPSDLGYSDEGYDLPPLKIHWHCVSVDHKKAWRQVDRRGQRALFLDKSSGLKDIAEVKRETILARLEKAKSIMLEKGIGEPPHGRHYLLWHDLESERKEIERVIPDVRTAYGSQDLEKREDIILGFSRGEFPILATKPSIAGSGCNFQKHCSDAIFLGSSYKFNDFIQAVHRVYRFLQTRNVNIHVIYSESEDPVIAALKTKWAQHNELVEKMSSLLRKFKLDLKTMEIKRSIGCDRKEVASAKFRAINNDCVLELMPIDFRHNSTHNPANENRGAKEVAQRTPQGEGDLRQEISPEESQKTTGAKSGMVSQKSPEVHRQGGGVLQAAPRKEKSGDAAIHEEARRQNRGQDASLVSQESEAGNRAGTQSQSDKEIRNNADAIRGDAENAGQQMRDLQTAVRQENSANGSLPQNRQGKTDSVLSVQHGIGTVSGQPETSAERCTVSWEPWQDNCVHLIVTSIPFGNQYEYSPCHNDFGCNPSNEEFFKQLDFLVPNLLRILMPGRLACIHVKDRIRFGNVTGKGVPTVDPFSDMTTSSFVKHGFNFLGRITIDTDVVRENAQTYRLGWSENSKDSTKMGVGMPEYVLLFRKPHSDLSAAYADLPVTKDKSIYTRADWQIDAAGFWKSNGNRLPDPDLLLSMPMEDVRRLWIEYSRSHGYEWKEHVEIAKALENKDYLPAAFMLFPPVSNHPGVWTDIVRMRVLNSEQSRRNQENHVCPLQLDIVNRLVGRYSNLGEIVLDPFAGIFTVPYCAVHSGRIGWGIELSHDYWNCGVGYCEQAEREHDMPTLFDLQTASLQPVINGKEGHNAVR